MNKLPLLLLPLVLLAPLRAEELSRDEVGSFKKKLVAALAAVGAAPGGFAKDKDDFVLPTDYSKDEGKVNAVSASVSRRFVVAGVRDASKNGEKLGMDYQQKMLAAQAKGDYAEMARLGQEMSQQAGANAMAGQKAQAENKTPVELRVALNESVDEGIDPDAVVVEKPGVLGLKFKQGGEDDPKETVKLYFQPALKDTKKLSRLKLFSKGISVPKPTSVGTVVVEMSGAAADVEAWAKRVDAAKILALIDAPAP